MYEVCRDCPIRLLAKGVADGLEFDPRSRQICLLDCCDQSEAPWVDIIYVDGRGYFGREQAGQGERRPLECPGVLQNL